MIIPKISKSKVCPKKKFARGVVRGGMLIYREFQSDICTSLCSFTELREVLAEEFPWFSTNVYFGECDSISSLQILPVTFV